MALTNQMLKAMGIENDQRDQIMTAHQEVLESIKAERDELRDIAAKVPNLEKKVQELEDAQPSEDWEKKYNELQEQYEGYKAKVAEEQAIAEKQRLYRQLLQDAGIAESKHVDAILKVANLDEVNVKDGAIEGAEELKEGITKEWEAFIPQITIQGAEVPTPPEGDEPKNGANPEVLKRLNERHERLYGKAQEKE